jgi:D-cysteine desulfhydrase
MIGRYPTPVRLLSELSTPRSELWVKQDDLTSDVYGGNKVRKLERILEAARARGARRIVTFGTAGSHQALATAIHGRRAGFEVAAILTPQPRNDYVVGNLRAAMAAGLQAFPASSFATVPIALARVFRRGDFVVDPGGSSVEGTAGYIDAAFELDAQVKSGELAWPDAIVVPLGSAGTAAGLTAGVVAVDAPARVIGVRIVGPTLMGKGRVVWLAHRAARRRSVAAPLAALAKAFELDAAHLGRGYGHASPEGARATELASGAGLALDATYTAKAFAAALVLVEAGAYRRVLYWHTLSSASLAPVLDGAPPLPPELDALFTS